MTLFEQAKASVTPMQAARRYGYYVERGGMIRCPFHDDRSPSMKLYDDHYYCFGCQASGDVIDFVSQLYGLDAKSAAEKLAADFQINYEQSGRTKTMQRTDQAKPDYRQQEGNCLRGLLNYLYLLGQWAMMYAPNWGDGTWHPLFAEAMREKDYIEYLLDVLLCGYNEERAALVKEYGKEVMKLERRSEHGTGDLRAS